MTEQTVKVPERFVIEVMIALKAVVGVGQREGYSLNHGNNARLAREAESYVPSRTAPTTRNCGK